MNNKIIGYCTDHEYYHIECTNRICKHVENKQRSFNFYRPLINDLEYSKKVVCSRCGFKTGIIKRGIKLTCK